MDSLEINLQSSYYEVPLAYCYKMNYSLVVILELNSILEVQYKEIMIIVDE